MNTQPTPPVPSPAPAPPRSATVRQIIALALVLGITVATIAYLMLTSRNDNREIRLGERVLNTQPDGVDELNTGQVIDTTENNDVSVKEGYRYKVLIDDMTREGTAGIARIGSLPVYISGAVKGDIDVIQVTSVRGTSANAELVERLVRAVPAATVSPVLSEESAMPETLIDITATNEALPVMGMTYRGTVTDTGSKGDGIVKVGGKVVFVSGADKGETVEFRITAQNDRFDTAELLRKKSASSEKPDTAEDILEGNEYVVTVTEKDRKDPENNGVARINGLVVFIPGTQPGDKVRIRVSDRSPRFARAVVLEKLQ